MKGNSVKSIYSYINLYVRPRCYMKHFICEWDWTFRCKKNRCIIISFLIWGIDKFSLRNANLQVPRTPFFPSFPHVLQGGKSTFLASDVAIRCGEKAREKYGGARVLRRLRFCIMDVISSDMKFEQLRRTPDISGRASSLFAESNAQICRHSKPRTRKLPRIKTWDAASWDAWSVARSAIGSLT